MWFLLFAYFSPPVSLPSIPLASPLLRSEERKRVELSTRFAPLPLAFHFVHFVSSHPAIHFACESGHLLIIILPCFSMRALMRRSSPCALLCFDGFLLRNRVTSLPRGALTPCFGVTYDTPDSGPDVDDGIRHSIASSYSPNSNLSAYLLTIFKWDNVEWNRRQVSQR